MAKVKSTSNGSKLVFGKKRSRKAKKKFGPREERPKRYKGQGR